MKLRSLIAFLFVFGIAAQVMAGPDDMEIRTWDALDCQHTMTTNHFELAPGEGVEIHLNLSGCSEPYKGMLFFGYNTTKNSSRQLTTRDGIRLTIVGDNALESFVTDGWEWTSDSGWFYLTMSSAKAASEFYPTQFVVYAENINAKKTKKIRLRSSAIYE